MRLVVCNIIIAFTNTTAKSQIYYNDFIRSERQWELDVNLGPTNFLGDVGGNKGKGTFFLKDINPAVTNIFIGANLSYYPKTWLGIRGSINVGKVAGYDSLVKNQGGAERDRRNRNLGFRSPITEAMISIEIYPLTFITREESFFQNKLRPYFTVGLGATYFNPQGQYQDAAGKKTWVDLRPLNLEGQGFAEYPDRKKYSNLTLQVPFGFGIKYFLDESWYVGAEILQRYTFTDYIDDVSKTYVDPSLFAKYLPKDQVAVAQQLMFRRALVNTRPVSEFIDKERGDKTNNDYYISVFFKLGFRFGSRNTDQSCPGGRRSFL